MSNERNWSFSLTTSFFVSWSYWNLTLPATKEQINFKVYCRSAKQTNLFDMGSTWMAMLLGLIEEQFLTKAYWIGTRSWSFSRRLTTNNLHSLQNFRFYSVGTLALDKSSLAAALISIETHPFDCFCFSTNLLLWLLILSLLHQFFLFCTSAQSNALKH